MIKFAIAGELSLDVISRLLAKYIRSKDSNMIWCDTGLVDVYKKGSRIRNRKIFTLLVAAFPGLRGVKGDFDSRACYRVLEDFFSMIGSTIYVSGMLEIYSIFLITEHFPPFLIYYIFVASYNMWVFLNIYHILSDILLRD